MHGIFELLPIAAFSEKKNQVCFDLLIIKQKKYNIRENASVVLESRQDLKKKSITQFLLLCCYALPASKLNVVLGCRLKVL